MRKFFKPLIMLSVVAAFMLSTVLCCCAMPSIHASSIKNMEKMAADPCQRDSSSRESSHSQGYCFLSAPTLDTVRVSTVGAPVLGFVFHSAEVLVTFEKSAPQVFALVRPAYGGKLLSLASPLPLYLQSHSLRL